MATFEDLWQLLYDNGSSNYYKYDCNRLWDELTPELLRTLVRPHLAALQQ